MGILVLVHVLCMFLVIPVSLSQAVNNPRPIFGIMTEPSPDSWTPYGSSFVNADYVKWLEAAGARVVPVPFDASDSELQYLFKAINGLVFPGGADIINHTLYAQTTTKLWNWAKDANDNGDYFPIHGTCLGFELEGVILSGGDVSILSSFDAENISLSLQLNPSYNARLFSLLTSGELAYLASANATDNYHHYGISFQDAYMNEKYPLKFFFQWISTSTDRLGRTFVSGWESYQYPFTGLQWHPERSVYEWASDEQIDHSAKDVRIMQAIAQYLVSEARKSSHTFPSFEAEQDALIYNYRATFTGKPPIDDDEQIYFFPQ
eukprot:ANDGO_05689.mRNA.1 Gamma-glutamyl hydrolase A